MVGELDGDLVSDTQRVFGVDCFRQQAAPGEPIVARIHPEIFSKTTRYEVNDSQVPIHTAQTHIAGCRERPVVGAVNFHQRDVECATAQIIDQDCLLSITFPFVAEKNRISMSGLGSGIYRAYCTFGFMETPDLPSVLRKVTIDGTPIDPLQVSYFLGKELLVFSNTIPMRNWRKRIRRRRRMVRVWSAIWWRRGWSRTRT